MILQTKISAPTKNYIPANANKQLFDFYTFEYEKCYKTPKIIKTAKIDILGINNEDITTSGCQGRVPASTGTIHNDAGTIPAQAGVPPGDAGTSPNDAGMIPAQAGTPPNDAGTLPNKAGTLPNKAGMIPAQAGATPNDAGGTHNDSGFGRFKHNRN